MGKARGIITNKKHEVPGGNKNAFGDFLFFINMSSEKDEKTLLEQERRELNTIIGKGVSFEVKDVEFETKTRFWGLVKKHIPHEVTRKFTIQEPTLSTLDRLSAEWVEFAIDEQELQKPESMKAARTLAHFHARRAAKVVAIAALGEERLIPKPCKAGTIWVEDEKRLEELTDLFARKIKPSRLHQLYNIVNTMSNLGDFVNSIRLMSIERTTVPNRIE